MYSTKNMLKAIQAFITINKLETLGVDYISRLAEAAKICENEDAWKLFGNLFSDDSFCKVYLDYVETSLV